MEPGQTRSTIKAFIKQLLNCFAFVCVCAFVRACVPQWLCSCTNNYLSDESSYRDWLNLKLKNSWIKDNKVHTGWLLLLILVINIVHAIQIEQTEVLKVPMPNITGNWRETWSNLCISNRPHVTSHTSDGHLALSFVPVLHPPAGSTLWTWGWWTWSLGTDWSGPHRKACNTATAKLWAQMAQPSVSHRASPCQKWRRARLLDTDKGSIMSALHKPFVYPLVKSERYRCNMREQVRERERQR